MSHDIGPTEADLIWAYNYNAYLNEPMLTLRDIVPNRKPTPIYLQEIIDEWQKNWEDLSLEERFDILRRTSKQSASQRNEMKHIEWHLDRGDLVCRC